MELIEAVNKQFNEEIGEAELHPKESIMMRMKYGLLPVSLVASEKNLIKKEEGGN